MERSPTGHTCYSKKRMSSDFRQLKRRAFSLFFSQPVPSKSRPTLDFGFNFCAQWEVTSRQHVSLTGALLSLIIDFVLPTMALRHFRGAVCSGPLPHPDNQRHPFSLVPLANADTYFTG